MLPYLYPRAGGVPQSITGAYCRGIVVELPFSLVRVRCRFLFICVPRGGGSVLTFFCLFLSGVGFGPLRLAFVFWSSAVVSFVVPLFGASYLSVVSFWSFFCSCLVLVLVLCVWPLFYFVVCGGFFFVRRLVLAAQEEISKICVSNYSRLNRVPRIPAVKSGRSAGRLGGAQADPHLVIRAVPKGRVVNLNLII